MKQLIAVTLLLGWLFASGHVIAEHGGEMGQHESSEVFHLGEHHDDAPHHESHSHDLTTAAGAQSFRQIAAPSISLPLCDLLIERMAALLREAAEPQAGIGIDSTSLDQRSSGWLLVCITARPVRGPSLV